jgi:hypothetical protein
MVARLILSGQERFPVFRPRSAAAIRGFIDADRLWWSGVIKAQNITLD